MVKYRTTASVALLAVIGTMFATVPAIAAATTPAVRLSGELVQVADQPGAGLAAIRLADGAHVPITAESVKDIASGSTVTLVVAVPPDVRAAAAANRTRKTRGVDGKEVAVRLRSSDLAAASDGSPESLTSAIGKATVAEAMAPGTPALEVSKVVAAAADPVSTYLPATRQVYVAVVTPKGATPGPPVDQAQIRAQVAGASSYWSDVTSGGVTLNVPKNAVQYTSAYTCSDPWGMWNEAKLKVGFPSTVPLPPNTSVVIALPSSYPSNCSYGMGTVGSNPNSEGYLYVADDVWPVLAHELGHNMSMQHANALLCPSAADSAYSKSTENWTGAGCTEDSYGDGQDVMSASTSALTPFAPFLSAPQSLRTGIIPTSAAAVTSTVGTLSVTLLPLAGRTGVRVAEVVNPNTGVTYYVEYRTQAGRDLKNVYGVKTGVRVLRYNPDTGATVLLDPSPPGQSRDPDPTLLVGKTFTSYDGGVSITTVSATPSNALVTVKVSLVGFTGKAPTRVLDTRDGTGTGGSKASLGAGQSLTLTVPGLPAGTTAVALNVTANKPTAASYLTVYPGGGTRPTASNLNYLAGQTIANMVMVPLGPGGKLTFYNAVGNVNVIADLVGSYTPGTGGVFTGRAPTRMLDTRDGTGTPLAKLGPDGTLTLTVLGLPAGATAVALNVAVAHPTTASYLTVYPGGTALPGASNLNFVAGQTIPNLVLVPLGPGNTVTFYNKAGTVNVFADLVGYYGPGTGAGFTGTAPTRVLDTRIGTGTGGSKAMLGAGKSLTLTVPGPPAGATAVALNVTATGATATSFLTVYPGGSTRPGASNLNYVPGRTIPNLVLVPLGAGGKVNFYNEAGNVHVIADLVGYYRF